MCIGIVEIWFGIANGKISPFLAHLSLQLRMSYCDHSPSVVRRRPSVVRRPFTLLNDFSSETPGPIFFKLNVEPSVKVD